MIRGLASMTRRTLTSFPHATTKTSVPQNISSIIIDIESNIQKMFPEMREELIKGVYHDTELKEMTQYYFDGRGKAIRPFIAITLGLALNAHSDKMMDSDVIYKQRRVAMIAEMIHSASLIHDDILDHAETRRGKSSINNKWNEKKATMVGSFILGISSKMLAELKNDEVTIVLSKVLSDLVEGEFQQLQNRNDDEERFELYLDKTFNKTASLITYSCQANAILSGVVPELVQASLDFGRSIGMAFQLVDDLLDFISSSEQLGKPAGGADLHLGLATAPVLFASETFPELKAMIIRRFTNPGDISSAFQFVLQSNGLERTQNLARIKCNDALKAIEPLKDSPYKSILINMSEKILHRMN